MKNIFIIAAENSAENYGIQVIEEFKRNNPNINFFGVGGDKFLKRGVDIIIHNKELAVVGIIDIISNIIKFKRHLNLLFQTAIKKKANAALLIDYPDFNLRIAKKLKKAGIPVYYYISPTVWAWRYSRVKLIKKFVKHIFIIFPFEIEIFKKEKISFTYTGHPLTQMIKIKKTKTEFRKKFGLDEPELIISLLPGSRKSEIVFLLPDMLKAMTQLKKEFKLKVFLLKADNIEEDLIQGYLNEISFQTHIINQEDGHDLINASDIILSTCGTSNLEIAMLGVPFVAVYRINKLTYLLGKRFIKINLYSIVNILAKKKVVAELIQNNYNVENILKEMRKILTNKDVRKNILYHFDSIKKMLTQNKNPTEIIYKKINQDLFNKKKEIKENF